MRDVTAPRNNLWWLFAELRPIGWLVRSFQLQGWRIHVGGRRVFGCLRRGSDQKRNRLRISCLQKTDKIIRGNIKRELISWRQLVEHIY